MYENICLLLLDNITFNFDFLLGKQEVIQDRHASLEKNAQPLQVGRFSVFIH